MELPLWVSAASGEAFHRVDTTKAHDAGLVARPLEEIVRGTLDEAATVVGVGLTPERESQLLHAWHAR